VRTRTAALPGPVQDAHEAVIFMTSKYYTHFVAEASEPAGPGEYSGVVELQAPLQPRSELKQLRRMLAVNFDLPAEDIRILNWATLH
jgi:hypothetical protein